VRRGHIPQNPVLLAKAPRLTEEETEPYTIEEVRHLLAVVNERRNGARWVVALALGLRQGEALGLKWEHVDLETGMTRIRRNRLRPKYEHGCGGRCGRKAGYCPERKQVRADTGPTKSRAGRRTIGLPDPLIRLLRTHREHQEAECIAARQLWHDEGWVFAKSDGRPLNPNTDYHEWKALLDEAGLRDSRLHDARHTAGTVLQRRGVASDATFRVRREDGAVRDGDPGTAGRDRASRANPQARRPWQESVASDARMLRPLWLHQTQAWCGKGDEKSQRRGQMPIPAGRQADQFSMAGNPLPTSFLLRVPTPTAMSIMGWSSPAMAKRYQHVLDAIRKDVANKVGGLLWEGIEINPADNSDDQDDEAARALIQPDQMQANWGEQRNMASAGKHRPYR
jgi:integrase-like protein